MAKPRDKLQRQSKYITNVTMSPGHQQGPWVCYWR